MKTALYRHFDANGRLLYVGISNDALRRLCQHKDRSHWFGQIRRVDVEWLETRTAALVAEGDAITLENPAWNKARPKRDTVRRPKGIRHCRTGRVDGWYLVPGDAEYMLGWWRAVFPGELFELAHPIRGGSFISSVHELKSIESEQWSTSPPNYDAGDAYDGMAA